MPYVDVHGGVKALAKTVRGCHVGKRYYLHERETDDYRSRFLIPLRWPKKIRKAFDALNDTSILMDYGYNVNADRALSEEQRHFILRTLHEQGIVRAGEQKKHIRWLIKTRAKMPHMDLAVHKWKSDLQYIETLKGKYKKK